MAAIGQTNMMAIGPRFFDFPCAQILVNSWPILHDRRAYVNVKNYFTRTATNNALNPSWNENDTVAGRWIKSRYNDISGGTLPHLFAKQKTLIIMQPTWGLFDADPEKSRMQNYGQCEKPLPPRKLERSRWRCSRCWTGGHDHKTSKRSEMWWKWRTNLIVTVKTNRRFLNLLAQRFFWPLYIVLTPRPTKTTRPTDISALSPYS